jgi:drug/metabolite transporter (DMT)-like permease
MTRWKPWIAFFFLGLLGWGMSFLWIKVALREIGPFTVVAYRMIFGTAAAWIITRTQKQPFSIRGKAFVYTLALGVVNTAIPFVLITWAETRIDSGLAGILNGTMPLFTILVAHFFLPDDRFSLPKAAGLATGFAGLVLLLSRDIGPNVLTGSLVGQLAVIVAAVCYATANVFTRLKLRGQHPIQTTAVSLTSSLVTLWILTPLVESPVLLPHHAMTWLALAWMGIMGSALAYLAYFYLINTWGSTRTAVVTYIFPVWAVILGVVFLGEHPGWHLLFGGGLVIAGIVLVNKMPKSQEVKKPKLADNSKSDIREVS